jgi:hypothetical protein
MSLITNFRTNENQENNIKIKEESKPYLARGGNVEAPSMGQIGNINCLLKIIFIIDNVEIKFIDILKGIQCSLKRPIYLKGSIVEKLLNIDPEKWEKMTAEDLRLLLNDIDIFIQAEEGDYVQKFLDAILDYLKKQKIYIKTESKKQNSWQYYNFPLGLFDFNFSKEPYIKGYRDKSDCREIYLDLEDPENSQIIYPTDYNSYNELLENLKNESVGSENHLENLNASVVPYFIGKFTRREVPTLSFI